MKVLDESFPKQHKSGGKINSFRNIFFKFIWRLKSEFKENKFVYVFVVVNGDETSDLDGKNSLVIVELKINTNNFYS